MKLNIQKFASGSFEFPNWSSGYAIRGKIEWSSTSSIESNSSVVTASIYVRRTSGYTQGKLWNGYVNIGGNNHTYSQIYTGVSTTVRQDWVLVQTFADTITHNADGTKTINISGQVTGPSGTGLEGKSSWGDSNVTLDTIPRASQPTLSSSSVTMGNSVTITTNRVSNSFTHTISYSFGNASGTIATNVGDSTTWTPPITLANQIPNSTSGTCTITCTTYNGDTLIGTKTVGLTLNVPSSVVPTVSIGTLTEANTTMQGLNWGVFVQNKSQLNIPITTAGSYSSTIVSVVTTINNVTFNGTNVITSTLVTAGNNTISTTVTDSRGRTATTTKTYNVVAYSNPTITTVQAQRCLSDGTLSDEGTYLLYSFVGSISSVSNNNAHTFRIGHKLISASTYTYTNIDTSNYSINKTDQVLNLNLSTSNSYDIVFEAIDSFMTNAINRTIDTGFDLMNFNPSGKSMAIGKVSEAGPNDELLEIGLDISFADTAKKSIFELLYPVGSIYMSTVSTNPSTLLGFGTWEQISGRFLYCTTTSKTTGGASSVSYTPAGSVDYHTLTVNEMPSHKHLIYQDANGSGSRFAVVTNYGDAGGQQINKLSSSGVSNLWPNSGDNAKGLVNADYTGSGWGHNHGFSGTQATIDTMPPWFSVYCWHRTA